MLIEALHNGTDKVMILGIWMGNPKDTAEITILYCDCLTGVIGYENGTASILANFVIKE